MTDPPRPGAGTSVRPDALADRAARVADAVAGLDPHALAGVARRVAAAAPASRSAAAAEELARRWEALVPAWADDVRAHGAALAASARDYAETDHATAAALRDRP